MGHIPGDPDPRPFENFAKTMPGLEEEVAQVMTPKRLKKN
jgi:hypothetical protein